MGIGTDRYEAGMELRHKFHVDMLVLDDGFQHVRLARDVDIVLIDALDWNRRLWSTLAVDCMDEGNKLPNPLRAQIISLSIWVTKYSSQVMQQGASLEPLIDINRTIMQGLQSAAA